MDNKLSIAVVGTGYVGLVTGVCFAELGFSVICLDKDLAKIQAIQKGHIPIYEPTLAELVLKNMANGRLRFETNLKSAMSACQIVFIAVGTPTHPTTGEADLSYVTDVAKELAPWLTQHKTIVVKSTVPVGTGQRIKEIILDQNQEAQFSMVSNPEFLREGSAVFDFMNPDRIIVGSECQETRQQMDKLYKPFARKAIPIVHTNIETAEMIKYAANCFLATKIAFVNEIAALCENLNADVENVMLGVGLDQRIGSGYLKPGPGYGGSCFPKDTLALRYAAEQAEAPLKILDAVIQSNEMRKKDMIQKIISVCGGSVAGKMIAILGVAFKANTDDVRDSAALTIIQGLIAKGAKIQAYDPEAMEKAAEVLQNDNIHWSQDVYEAIAGADALVIVTEWEIFGCLDLARIKKLMRSSAENGFPLFIDLRNLYLPKTITDAGFCYASIGRPVLIPTTISSISTTTTTTTGTATAMSSTMAMSEAAQEKIL